MQGRKKTKTGIVVSDKMDKTVVVVTHRMTRHPLYKKYIRRRVKFKAHDELNQCQTGDTVTVQETRPLSRDNRWRIVEVVPKAI